jgi:hypothetical protein
MVAVSLVACYRQFMFLCRLSLRRSAAIVEPMIGVYPEACVSIRAADWFKHLVPGSEMRVLFLDDILDSWRIQIFPPQSPW